MSITVAEFALMLGFVGAIGWLSGFICGRINRDEQEHRDWMKRTRP